MALDPKHRYEDHVLYTALEPCLLCVGATVMATVARVRYAGADPYGGGDGGLVGVNPHVERLPLQFDGPPRRRVRGARLGAPARLLHPPQADGARRPRLRAPDADDGRQEYELLQRVRTEGAWEDWLRFFLEGVIEVAASATDTTRRIVEIVQRDRGRIHALGRGAATAHRVHNLATRSIVVRPVAARQQLGLTDPPIYAAIKRLEALGVLREATGRRRGRLYVYDGYLSLLVAGTEPL